MAAPKKANKNTKTNVKQSNFGLKNKNITGRKKVLALTVLAFALVGVVMLIRSFAATVVVSIDPSVTTTPGLVSTAPVVTETVTSGKKTTSKNIAELNVGNVIKYNLDMFEGQYKFCFTAKPMNLNSGVTMFIEYDIEPRPSMSDEYRAQINGRSNGYQGVFDNSFISYEVGTLKEECNDLYFVPKIGTTGQVRIRIENLGQSNTNSEISKWQVTNIKIEKQELQDIAQHRINFIMNNSSSYVSYDPLTKYQMIHSNKNAASTISSPPRGSIPAGTRAINVDSFNSDFIRLNFWSDIPAEMNKTYRFCTYLRQDGNYSVGNYLSLNRLYYSSQGPITTLSSKKLMLGTDVGNQFKVYCVDNLKATDIPDLQASKDFQMEIKPEKGTGAGSSKVQVADMWYEVQQ